MSLFVTVNCFRAKLKKEEKENPGSVLLHSARIFTLAPRLPTYKWAVRNTKTNTMQRSSNENTNRQYSMEHIENGIGCYAIY